MRLLHAASSDPALGQTGTEMHVIYRDIDSNLRDAFRDGQSWRQVPF